MFDLLGSGICSYSKKHIIRQQVSGYARFTLRLLFCLSRKINLSAPAQRLLEAAGNMTYSSYLAQFPIQLLIALGFAMSGRPIPFYDVWFFGVFVSSTLLISYLTYRYFEAPAQTLLRNHLLPGAEAAVRANAAA